MVSTRLKLVVATAVCAALVYAVLDTDKATAVISGASDRSEVHSRLEGTEPDALRTRGVVADRGMFAALHQALLTRVLTADQPEADEEPVAKGDPASPFAQATRTLDDRMLKAATSGQGEELERTLQAVLDSGFLGDTNATLFCGRTICRVDLSDEDNARASEAVRKFAERVPKTFGAMAAYPLGSGEAAIYVALKSDDLMLGSTPPPPDTVVAEPPSAGRAHEEIAASPERPEGSLP